MSRNGQECRSVWTLESGYPVLTVVLHRCPYYFLNGALEILMMMMMMMTTPYFCTTQPIVCA